MTTAHRPTWNPARGGGTARDLGKTAQYSSRDLPGQLTLKTRQQGQGTTDEVSAVDAKQSLESREREAQRKKRRGDAEEDHFGPEGSSKQPTITFDSEYANLDADDPSEDESDSDSDSDDDDDDDTADLLLQLEAIKKEREMEKREKEEEEMKEQESIRKEQYVMGNPLLNQSEDYDLKRKWTDDTVFKNCAKGDSMRKDKRFINDTLRSDFHKKFMKKYVK